MAETPFQVTGVASGIAWDEIITKTLELAKKPAEVWESKIDTLEYKKSLYSELASEFRKLQNTLLQLNIESTYKAKTAEFVVRPMTGGATNAADIAKATVNANADIAAWDIEVTQLATAQRYVSGRQSSTSTALGISGTFRIHVDSQVASITVASTDTLADINKKIQSATDQKGQTLMATAKIFDNRLVIESALTGLDKTGTLSGVNLTMSNKLVTAEYVDPRDSSKTLTDYITYMPKGVNGSYPSQLLSVSSDGRNYEEGVDYTYNPSNGAITWKTLDSSNNEFVTHPADGDTIKVETVISTSFTMDASGVNTLQPPSSGTSLSGSLFTITDEDGNKYTGAYAGTGATAVPNSQDFVVTDDGSGNYKILWGDGNQTIPPGTGGTGNFPASGKEYYVYIRPATVISTGLTMSSTGGVPDAAPLQSSLFSTPLVTGSSFIVTDNNGKNYTGTYAGAVTAVPVGQDFVIADDGSGNYKIIWGDGAALGGTGVRPADHLTYDIKSASGDYEYARNQVRLEEDGASSNANSVLVQLGFMTEDTAFPGTYIFDSSLVTAAQDATVIINGVPITIPDNEISADSDSGELIPNVKLELLGVGHVVMNITQDASGAVEAMEKFVEAYNSVMTLINTRLSEKYDQSTVSTDDDYLQSLLSESKSTTVFGALYGDQLLWNIKNQLRSMVTNSISTLTSSLRSVKVQHTDSALNVEGSFYINSGGNVARIDVVPTDSMEDIQRKLQFTSGINGATATTPLKADMGLDVTISNGQLVIKKPSSTKTTETYQDTLTRSSGSIAYLYYVPDSSPPINGQLTVTSGDTTYTENVDYTVSSFENDNGVMETRLEWITGGKSPSIGSTYNVQYVFDPSAVTFSPVPSSALGNVSSSGALYDIDFLDLHTDSSKIQLSAYGLTTESLDYGKSGLLEFDPDTFFQGIVDDAAQVSRVMVAFMKGMDSYIDNLASSSQVTVGGTTVTKGRISAAMDNIDTEVASLQESIDRLETQLAQRQETLYKQYTNMELAIQKLNAQMSSMSQYMSLSTSSS